MLFCSWADAMFDFIMSLGVIVDTGAGTEPLLDIGVFVGEANWGPYGFEVGVDIMIGANILYIL
jgi:hypothetical protein